jgi:hypothetical protein
MIGPFTIAPGGFTHVLVAIDKFTKWIEYKPIAKLTPDRVVHLRYLASLRLPEHHHHRSRLKFHGQLVLGVL